MRTAAGEGVAQRLSLLSVQPRVPDAHTNLRPSAQVIIVGPPTIGVGAGAGAGHQVGLLSKQA